MIGPNPKLFPKTLFSELGEGEPVRVVDCDNEEHEAERAVARIQSMRGAQRRGAAQDWKDFAVLYRANHQARVFEQALRKAQIPYKVSGGQSFFDRAEIKDLCAWLRLIVNNDDDPAFLRAVTTPKRGIGHQTLQRSASFAGQYKLEPVRGAVSPSLADVLPRARVGGLHEFGRYVNDLEYRARHTIGAEDAKALPARLAEGHRLREAPVRRRGQREARRGALDQRAGLLRLDGAALRRRDRRRRRRDVESETQERARGGADHLADHQPQRARQDQNVVTLSTLHAAKGLEWPHVMLAGVNEGLLPFKPSERRRAATRAQRLQEERRLMYVGITRRQRTLAVSTPSSARRAARWSPRMPSRFIAEMTLDETQRVEDPRAKLKALRAAAAARARAARGETTSP